MSSTPRSGERVQMLGDLHGEIMVFQPMLIREISSGGASIETTAPLALDSLHDLRLTLGSTALVLKARVVHSRVIDIGQDNVTYTSGVEFVDVPERVRAAIGQFLDAIKAERSGV